MLPGWHASLSKAESALLWDFPRTASNQDKDSWEDISRDSRDWRRCLEEASVAAKQARAIVAMAMTADCRIILHLLYSTIKIWYLDLTPMTSVMRLTDDCAVWDHLPAITRSNKSSPITEPVG